MGGSSSSNSTTRKTKNIDKRTMADNGAIAAQGSVNVERVDPEVVEAALKEGSETVRAALGQALGFASDTQEEAFSIQQQSGQLVNEALEQSTPFAQGFQDTLKAGVAIAAIAGAAWAFTRG
jgi:hypothetical protein